MTATASEQFARGEALGVDVGAIERELKALWRQAAEQDETVVRACSWNLAVYVQGDSELNDVKELVGELVERIPARTLLLNHRPDGDGREVEAWVSARCRRALGGAKLLCSEEITIEVRDQGAHHLPSLVRALVESDTPTAVMLPGGQLSDSHLVEALLGGADALLIDSGHGTGLRALARLRRRARLGSVAVADLQWLRSAPVREGLAAAFDAPTAARAASSVRAVTAWVGQGAESSGALLLGWLASRLGWDAGAPGKAPGGWVFQRRGGEVQARLEPVPRSVPCGVERVELTLDDGARLEVAFDGASALVVTVAGSSRKPVNVPPYRPVELYASALSGRGPDHLFAPALQAALELEP